MSVEVFEQVVAKITASHPGQRVFINLYNWGESIVHPKIDEVIRVCHRAGMGAGLSSNLNLSNGLEKAISANPEYLRISVSGFYNDNYSRTHRRGNVLQVKSNMYFLRTLIDRAKADTVVQVGYHLYRHNGGEEYARMRVLCEELDFLLLPQVAMLMPLEKAVPAADHGPEDSDRELHDMLLVSPREWKDELRGLRKDYPDCALRAGQTTINADGTVPLCCATYDPANNIADNFLDVPHDELQARKYRHPFCRTCRGKGMDMMFSGAQSPRLQSLVLNVLNAA